MRCGDPRLYHLLRTSAGHLGENACVEKRLLAKVVIGLRACRRRMSQAFGYCKMNSLADGHVVSMSCKMQLGFFEGGVGHG